jgi:hypothetical protein
MESYDDADAIERAWRHGLTPDPLLTVSEWADRYRVLSQRVVRAGALADRAHAVPEGDQGLSVAVLMHARTATFEVRASEVANPLPGSAHRRRRNLRCPERAGSLRSGPAGMALDVSSGWAA